MRKPLIFLSAALLLSACTSRDLHRECKQHDECPEGQVCQFDVCVDEGSAQDKVCREGFAFCDGECTDTQSQLATCGGCDGCPVVENAEAVSCTQGVCQYTCTGDWRDRDDNPANGCDCPAGTDCDCIPDGPELCDLRDNDCDGTVDNVLLTDEGAEWRAHCPDYPNGSAIGCEAGSCTYACDAGFVDRSEAEEGCECEITAEVCNGADDDCDGVVDFTAANAAQASCPQVTGAAHRCVVGECTYVCDSGVDVDGDLSLGTGGNGCECSRTGEEVCDGLDNDCDGLVDALDDFTTELCANQTGVCNGASRECRDGQTVACSAETYASHASANNRTYQIYDALCDGRDNDCSGQADQNCCSPDEPLAHVATLWPPGEVPWSRVAGAATPGGSAALVVASRSDRVSAARLDLSMNDVTRTDLGDIGAERIGVVWSQDQFWIALQRDVSLTIVALGPALDQRTETTVTLEAAPAETPIALCLLPTESGAAVIYEGADTVHALSWDQNGAEISRDEVAIGSPYVVDCVAGDNLSAVLVESETRAHVITLNDSTGIEFGPQITIETGRAPVELGLLDEVTRVPGSALAANGPGLLVAHTSRDASLVLSGIDPTLRVSPVAGPDWSSNSGLAYLKRIGDQFAIAGHYSNWLLFRDGEGLEPSNEDESFRSGLLRGPLSIRHGILRCGVTYHSPLNGTEEGWVACTVREDSGSFRRLCPLPTQHNWGP